MNKIRCDWCTTHPLYLDYHDNEWGVPLYDEMRLFEFLMLEGMQAGLSWLTVLKKREAFRIAFAGFNPEEIARFSSSTIQDLLQNKSIIRNRRKIEAMVTNAQAFLDLQEHTSLTDFLWAFVDGKPQQNHWQTKQEVPANTQVSDKMAKALKQHKFKFVGTTMCYAFMQATGMVNDHLVDCYRYTMIRDSSKTP
jgi:DNA-3-methyladenine glycosylase I